MGKKSETFQQFTGGIQNVVFIVAALIGGWWALRTYVFEHPGFHEKGSEFAGVPFTGSIEVEQLSAEPKSRLVSVRVILSHKSHLTEIIGLSQNPLLASLVQSDPHKSPVVAYGYPVVLDDSGKQSMLRTAEVPPGEETSLVFAFSPPRSGLYLLQFDPCAGGLFARPCVIQKYVSVR
jgi:hypothetical protein